MARTDVFAETRAPSSLDNVLLVELRFALGGKSHCNYNVDLNHVPVAYIPAVARQSVIVSSTTFSPPIRRTLCCPFTKL